MAWSTKLKVARMSFVFFLAFCISMRSTSWSSLRARLEGNLLVKPARSALSNPAWKLGRDGRAGRSYKGNTWRNRAGLAGGRNRGGDFGRNERRYDRSSGPRRHESGREFRLPGRYIVGV